LTPSTDNTHEAVLSALRRLVAGAPKPQNNPGIALQFFTNATRAQLAKLYGEEAAQLSHFSRVAGGLSPASAREELARRIAHVQRIIEDLDRLPDSTAAPLRGRRIFIGHGHSPLWRELKDFIAERLHLPWDEFNREPVAGLTTTERLQAMVAQAAFAFLVLTADEEHANARLHARSNVVHEVGLFQGRENSAHPSSSSTS
jgi:predicted nucleotide-binding protein